MSSQCWVLHPQPQHTRGGLPQPPHLQNLLHAPGHVVVLRAHNVGVHDAGGGVQRVHGRVDAQLSDGAGQDSSGVQVGKGGGGGRVGQVVSWHVDGLGRWEGTVGPRQVSRLPQRGRASPALTCTEVMEPLRVVVILSCMVPMSVASVGW